MKKSLWKTILSFAVCLTMIGLGSSIIAHADSDSGSYNYGSYGNLSGTNNFYKESGLPLAKRVDLDARIGVYVDYIGVKLTVEDANSGNVYYNSGSFGRSGTYYHIDWDFLKSERANIYNNTCLAFGTHEFRDADSGAFYTETQA